MKQITNNMPPVIRKSPSSSGSVSEGKNDKKLNFPLLEAEIKLISLISPGSKITCILLT
jgi:hypothetical protein